MILLLKVSKQIKLWRLSNLKNHIKVKKVGLNILIIKMLEIIKIIKMIVRIWIKNDIFIILYKNENDYKNMNILYQLKIKRII